MNLVELLKMIEEDWVTLVAVFTLGGIWLQGKQWFGKVNDSLDKALRQHDNQTDLLRHIEAKTELLEERSDSIENIVNEIHEKLHKQEVKLAVLETVSELKKQNRGL